MFPIMIIKPIINPNKTYFFSLYLFACGSICSIDSVIIKNATITSIKDNNISFTYFAKNKYAKIAPINSENPDIKVLKNALFLLCVE